MKTIYIVTTGEYSDYSVRGVYSTKKKAEFAKKLMKSENPVEEWQLNNLPKHPKGMLYWHVRMDESGNVCTVEQESPLYKRDEDWAPYGDDSHVSFFAWAKNEKGAIKIANEKRVQLIASGEWTSDWETWVQRRTKKP